ncbi:MAG: hypothetical protein LBH35_11105, partial [Treponema sp.]|nr:hypothetical protein [Treponema sp.]
MNNTNEPGTIGSIDIKVGGFFKCLRSWNDDSLVAFDGRGRFSEITFQGESGVRIKPLIQFP